MFVDGATGAKNPFSELWNQALDMWSNGRLEDNVKCLVSIGTRMPPLRPFATRQTWKDDTSGLMSFKDWRTLTWKIPSTSIPSWQQTGRYAASQAVHK